MNSPAVRLRDYWSSIRVDVRPGVSHQAIQSFESKNGVLLPGDFSQYLLSADGMNGSQSDDALISFWPLDSVATIPECLSDFAGIPDYSQIGTHLRDAGSYFVFADYLIWSHVYAIKLSPCRADRDLILWVCGSNYCLVAESFSEFLQMYLDDPESVLFPSESQRD